MEKPKELLKYNWEKQIPQNNSVLYTDFGAISYNPDPNFSADILGLSELENFVDGSGKEETAILVDTKEGRKYFILYGDYRSLYEGKTLSECLEIFGQNIENIATSSNLLENITL